jgi:hypothetical protein
MGEAILVYTDTVRDEATDYVTAVIDRLGDLATQAYAEIRKLDRTDHKKRKDADLSKFQELLAFLENEIHFRDPIQFSDHVVKTNFDFWCKVTLSLAPEFPRQFFPEIAAAAYMPVYTHMCVCRKNPCMCTKDDLALILRFLQGIMCASVFHFE